MDHSVSLEEQVHDKHNPNEHFGTKNKAARAFWNPSTNPLLPPNTRTYFKFFNRPELLDEGRFTRAAKHTPAGMKMYIAPRNFAHYTRSA